jgi:TPR repeat protein/tRNA A-37 threonylcarbamoyl transferase component Bud32
MKYCTECGSSYPNDFQTCPKDQTVLQIASELAPGLVIREKWVVLDKIGAGGMATVYRVKHLAFGTIRAIKVINPSLAEDATFVKRFRAEAVMAQKLQHPNVIRVEDLDTTDDGRPFIVMEYVAGRDLRNLIAQEGTLRIARALDITAQIASALAAAHRLSITHRDIKPDNILMTVAPDGSDVVKVTDFGIAKAREGGAVGALTFGTETGVLIGTPAYMSPEQVMGKRDGVDARSDLYSLCIVLYEMVTGKLPFESDTPLGMALSRLNSQPVPPHQAKPEMNIPRLLSDIVMKALERDREKRFQTADEFISALQRYAVTLAGAKTVVASAPVEEIAAQESSATAAVAPAPESWAEEPVVERLPASVPSVWQAYETAKRFHGSRNFAEAVRWYKAAAEQGHAEAQFELGKLHEEGGDVPEDKAEAARWYRMAAEQGHPRAQVNLGWLYRMGEGVPEDLAEAARWFRKAAEQGDTYGQERLAWMYRKGYGVPKDYEEAARWYRMAAEQGDEDAQNALGFFYAMGRGLPQNDAEAVRWYRAAAEQSHKEAQFNLGECYELGVGVPKDLAEAARWYKMAAEQEHENAKRALRRMAVSSVAPPVSAPVTAPVPAPISRPVPTPKRKWAWGRILLVLYFGSLLVLAVVRLIRFFFFGVQ